MSDEQPEALRRIEQRLSQAADAAERLIAEAGRRRPPPAGWQAPPQEGGRHGGERAPELELLHAGARLLDELVPSEVIERLAAALRELLLAVRALLDFYVERLGRERSEGEQRVQDIPIE